jgi:hypothetical protein
MILRAQLDGRGLKWLVKLRQWKFFQVLEGGLLKVSMYVYGLGMTPDLAETLNEVY